MDWWQAAAVARAEPSGTNPSPHTTHPPLLVNEVQKNGGRKIVGDEANDALKPHGYFEGQVLCTSPHFMWTRWEERACVCERKTMGDRVTIILFTFTFCYWQEMEMPWLGVTQFLSSFITRQCSIWTEISKSLHSGLHFGNHIALYDIFLYWQLPVKEMFDRKCSDYATIKDRRIFWGVSLTSCLVKSWKAFAGGALSFVV